jgi:hypothetical protein
MMAFFTVMRTVKGLGLNKSAWRSFTFVVLTDIKQTIFLNYVEFVIMPQAHSIFFKTYILTIITRVTIMTVQFVVSNSNISSHKAITQLNMTNTAFEAVNVIKQPQTFDYHCCTTTCKS